MYIYISIYKYIYIYSTCICHINGGSKNCHILLVELDPPTAQKATLHAWSVVCIGMQKQSHCICTYIYIQYTYIHI